MSTTPEAHEQRASRACAECHKSKTRCIWTTDMGVGKCRRCARSKRICTFTEPETKRRAVSNRVGQLEEKIDGIVSLLNGGGQLQPGASLPAAGQQQPTQPLLLSPKAHAPASNYSSGGPGLAVGGPRLSENKPVYPVSPSRYSVEVIPGLQIAFDEADRLLRLYNASYSPSFPFVPLPPSMTARRLYSTQPLLFRAIMQVCMPQPHSTQRGFGRWFRAYIAQHVIVDQEERLEILQAIILHIAWADLNFYCTADATNLLQLAIAQVVNMGLSQPPKGPTMPATLLNEMQQSQNLKLPPRQSLEEIRSMLGCFFLSSLTSLLLRKMPQFPYTQHLTMCCRELSNVQEHASDHYLVALIRMQRIACRVRTVMPSPEIDGISAVGFSGSLYMTMSAIHHDLESLKNDLPREIQDNFFFSVNYYGILTRIYDPAIYTRTSLASGEAPDSSRRTDALWRCLETTKRFFDAFVAIPAESLPYLPFPGPSFLSFGLITASWLLFLNDSDWDVEMARKSFDFALVLDRLSARYEEAERVAAAAERTRKRKFWDENLSMSAIYRDKLRWTKTWYLSKVAPAAEPSSMGLSSDADANLGNADFVSPDGLDSAFWEALMSEDLWPTLQVDLQ